MTCEIAFLPVGNADTIIINPDEGSTVIVDLHKLPLLRKWLKRRRINRIARIYITHEHRDHFPKLETLVTFLDGWLKEGGQIQQFCLPYDAYSKAKQKVNVNREQNKDLEDALLRLRKWERKNIIRFLEPVRGEKYTNNEDCLTIEVLHPGLLYAKDHLVTVRGRHNEISTVLKIKYGVFCALLLADIEGDGLQECLDCNGDNLKSHIVKIPHHGAYPRNGEVLKQLLESIDPEAAILSVGSKNRYGHVMPELFSLLLDIQRDESTKLEKFLCTEVTRTCACSKEERAMMNRSGLPERQLCAGEITITANISGQWELSTETEHKDIVSKLQFPACQGEAELV